MSERPEPELEALQRRLDDGFAASSPREGFGDDLWARIQASRGWRGKLHDGWAAATAPRRLPAFAAAAAVLLLVFAGSYRFGRASHPPAPAAQSTSRGGSRAAAPQLELPAAPTFGKLPVPGQRAVSAAGAADLQGGQYTGPVVLKWTGKMPAVPHTGPVYRYREPAAADANAFAASVGATALPLVPNQSILGLYGGPDYQLTVFASNSTSGREPIYALTPHGPDSPAGLSPSEQVARDGAARFLDEHKLTPAWPYDLSVKIVPGFPSLVRYSRVFEVPGAGRAPEVDAAGQTTGTDLTVKADGGVFQASGPLPLPVDLATYPFRSSDAVVAALSKPPQGTSGSGPAVMVNVDHVQLVYVVATAGGYGYYEPAYLFSGTFNSGGRQYAKSVVVPAVDQAQLRS